MSIISLKKPVIVDGKEWTQVDFDPSIEALEAFEAALANGRNETAAVRILMTHDGDTPPEVVGKIRMSDLLKVKEAMGGGPLAVGSTGSGAGEA